MPRLSDTDTNCINIGHTPNSISSKSVILSLLRKRPYLGSYNGISFVI